MNLICPRFGREFTTILAKILRFSLIIMGTLLDEVTYCCNMIRQSLVLKDLIHFDPLTGGIMWKLDLRTRTLRRRARHARCLYCFLPSFFVKCSTAYDVLILRGLHCHFLLHDAQHASGYPCRGCGQYCRRPFVQKGGTHNSWLNTGCRFQRPSQQTTHQGEKNKEKNTIVRQASSRTFSIACCRQ